MDSSSPEHGGFHYTLPGLPSCTQEAAMTLSDNISLMKRWYDEVWRGRSDETVRELLASAASLWGQFGPEQEIKGPEAFVAFAHGIRNAFPDSELVVEDAFAVGDKVAVRWTATGTHEGEISGAAPTHKRIRITGITIVRIVNGKIVEGWDNWDRLGMLQQIGAYAPQQAPVLAKSA
jgi:steroid delta-isomerase-like uncharacterized protein